MYRCPNNCEDTFTVDVSVIQTYRRTKNSDGDTVDEKFIDEHNEQDLTRVKCDGCAAVVRWED